MLSKRNRLIIAASFFVIWVGILYAGADHPPPVGFIWVMLLCLIATVLVYFRAPIYASWSATHCRFRLLRVLLDGTAVGLVFAFITIVFNNGGEPTIQPTGIDTVIWFVVLVFVGAANALLIYFVTSMFTRFAKNGR